MKRVLTFAAWEPKDQVTSPEARRFGLLFRAFVLGGDAVNAAARGARARDVRAKEARILRALKSIAELVNDGRSYRLQAAGGELLLDQKAFEMLEDYVEKAPIPTLESDAHDDLMDWLGTAEKRTE